MCCLLVLESILGPLPQSSTLLPNCISQPRCLVLFVLFLRPGYSIQAMLANNPRFFCLSTTDLTFDYETIPSKMGVFMEISGTVVVLFCFVLLISEITILNERWATVKTSPVPFVPQGSHSTLQMWSTNTEGSFSLCNFFQT